MKKTALFAVLLLCTAAVLTAGCVGPTEPIDYPTALIGDWKSIDKTSYGDREFSIIYHFGDDNMGTMDGEMNGEIFNSVPVGWGYLEEENRYVVGYLTTSNYDYFYISKDGKTITNQNGAEFKRI